MNYGNNVGIVPLTDAAGITQGFKPGKHYGVDIGWYKEKYCAVLAWQDGKVIAKGYYSDTGFYVAIEHTYSMTKRWTCYIHLRSNATVNIGDKVQLGQKIGVRGNSGSSKGIHLHLYLTSEIAKNIKFSFTNLKKYAVNPVPYLYYDKKFNTIYISKDWEKHLPNPLPEVVDPVARDERKNQLICHEADLRVRTGASVKKEVIGYLLKDQYYDWFDSKESGGYTWYKLAENQWCAKIESVDILPKQDYYIVQEGDTLESIANKYCMTLDALIALNPQLIHAGDVLRVL